MKKTVLVGATVIVVSMIIVKGVKGSLDIIKNKTAVISFTKKQTDLIEMNEASIAHLETEKEKLTKEVNNLKKKIKKLHSKIEAN